MKRAFAAIFLIVLFSIAAEGPIRAAAKNEALKNGKMPAESSANKTDTLDDILAGLDARFGQKNFSADFTQASTLKAMDITDTANGRVWFMHPGKMRWEYLTPEKYAIITDGATLWIYRPADRQVIVGDAGKYFSNGKGASFLTDIRRIRDSFSVTIIKNTRDFCRIKLVPFKKDENITEIVIEISLPDYDIKDVVTKNAAGDETRLTFDNIRFDPKMDPAFFKFSIPPGTDILEMEQ